MLATLFVIIETSSSSVISITNDYEHCIDALEYLKEKLHSNNYSIFIKDSCYINPNLVK